jgi:hypothetical protein
MTAYVFLPFTYLDAPRKIPAHPLKTVETYPEAGYKLNDCLSFFGAGLPAPGAVSADHEARELIDSIAIARNTARDGSPEERDAPLFQTAAGKTARSPVRPCGSRTPTA